MQDRIEKVANLIKKASYDKSDVHKLLLALEDYMEDYQDMKYHSLAESFKNNVDNKKIDVDDKEVQMMAEFLDKSYKDIDKYIGDIKRVIVKCDKKVYEALNKIRKE